MEDLFRVLHSMRAYDSVRNIIHLDWRPLVFEALGKSGTVHTIYQQLQNDDPDVAI